MSDMTATRTSEGVVAGPRPGRVLPYLVYTEVIKLLRIPQFAIPTFLFPVMFFAMFGLPNVNDKLGGINAGAYLLASYGTYAVMSVSLFSFGVSIASERGLGWNRLLRASPLGGATYFTAKIIMALLVGLATLLLLFGFGALVGGIGMGAGTWFTLTGMLVLGMVPFVALGLWLGYLAGPNSAAAIANLIFLPLSFASGLFVPIDFLPKLVQNVAPYLPSYHVAQLAYSALGSGDGRGVWVHLAWLAGSRCSSSRWGWSHTSATRGRVTGRRLPIMLRS